MLFVFLPEPPRFRCRSLAANGINALAYARAGSPVPGASRADGRGDEANAAGHLPAICVKQQRINRINRINRSFKKRLPTLAKLDKASFNFNVSGQDVF